MPVNDAPTSDPSADPSGDRPANPPAGAPGSAPGEPGQALLLFAVTLLLLIVIGSLSQAYRPGPGGTALTEVLAILLPALVFSRARRRHALVALRLAPVGESSLWAVLGGVLLGLGWFYLLAGWIEPLWEHWFPVPAADRARLLRLLRPDGGLRPLGQDLLCFGAVPALCEEVLFRGALLPLLRPVVGPLRRPLGAVRVPQGETALAVVTCALLFGIFHLSWSKLFPTTLLGLGFGAAAVWSGSLWAAIAMHFVNNAVVVLLTRAGLDDAPPAAQTIATGQGLLLAAAALLCIAAGHRVLLHAARLRMAAETIADADTLAHGADLRRGD